MRTDFETTVEPRLAAFLAFAGDLVIGPTTVDLKMAGPRASAIVGLLKQ